MSAARGKLLIAWMRPFTFYRYGKSATHAWAVSIGWLRLIKELPRG